MPAKADPDAEAKGSAKALKRPWNSQSDKSFTFHAVQDELSGTFAIFWHTAQRLTLPDLVTGERAEGGPGSRPFQGP